MKPFISLLSLLFILSACSSSKKSTSTTNNYKNGIELKNYTDSVSYSLGLLYGQSLKAQGFEDMNNELLLEVFGRAINNQLPGDDSLLISKKDASPMVNNYFIKKQQVIASKNLSEGEAFLAANKTKSGVVTTASGLQYKVLKEGSGASPNPNSSVTVYYTGTLLDGTVFDGTKPGSPATFNLGGLIQGWKEGLLLMKEGAKFKFFIPSSLAYGERGSQGAIGPNATILFEVELVKVN
jgi:FKBP-type peptidyl-prolyl cis-trans isomerase